MVLSGSNDGRQLHREQNLAEEPLFSRLEAGASRGFGAAIQRRVLQAVDDSRQFEGLFHILMDDRPGIRIGVVDLDLGRRQLVPENVIFDTGEAERARHVEACRLQVASDQLHGRDTALSDAADELLTVGKSRFWSPKAKADGVCEIVDVGCTGRRGVEHTGTGQLILEKDATDSLLRALLCAESALPACDPAHLMGFVKRDDAFEIAARPLGNLFQPAVIAA